MIDSVNASSPIASNALPSRAPAGLDTELSKCQTQLSDWTHCVSAKTPEGKAKIAEISEKIENIKAQMQKVEQSRPPKPVDTVNAVAQPQAAALTTLGGYIDVHV